jgi:hypothetical protein
MVYPFSVFYIFGSCNITIIFGYGFYMYIERIEWSAFGEINLPLKTLILLYAIELIYACSCIARYVSLEDQMVHTTTCISYAWYEQSGSLVHSNKD